MCLFTSRIYSQFPWVFSKTNDNNSNDCEGSVEVSEVRPELSSCSLPQNYILYPVYIENFNYKNELPNNWAFKYGCQNDDDPENRGRGLCWLGNGADGLESFYRDISVSNGIAHLQVNQTNTITNRSGWGCCNGACCPDNNCTGPKDYNFTTSFLISRFNVREGKTEAFIRIPNNNLMWPAFWLFGAEREEIDIFEFYDKKIADPFRCNVYSDMRMTLHGTYYGDGEGDDENICSRGRKVPVSEISADYFKDFHLYSCVFNDYEVEISVDQIPVGSAKKFYDGTDLNNGCHYHGDHNFPDHNISCEEMQNLSGNKNISVDYSFPTPNVSPMTVRINNAINLEGVDGNGDNYGQNLLNSWNTWEQKDVELQIDHFTIWQPVNCGATYNISSVNEFNVNAGYTSFLGGNDITIGTVYGTNTFQPVSNLYSGQENNIQLLATDYIAFVGDVVINTGGADSYTYLRAEIIDCSGFRPDKETVLSTESIDPTKQAEPTVRNTTISTNSVTVSAMNDVNNDEVVLYPNPAHDIIKIKMSDKKFDNLDRMEIIDNLGRKFLFNKAREIDISLLSNGYYELKLIFIQGDFIIKPLMKV